MRVVLAFIISLLISMHADAQQAPKQNPRADLQKGNTLYKEKKI